MIHILIYVLLDDYNLHVFILILMVFFTTLIKLDIESISIITLHHNHMFTMRMLTLTYIIFHHLGLYVWNKFMAEYG